MRAWSLLAIAGCGRIGFDPISAPPAIDATPPSIAESLPCATQVLLDSGGHNPHDVLRWIRDGLDEWLVGADHYGQDDHKIERHRIAAIPNAAVVGPAEFMVQADHVDILGFATTTGGLVMGFPDFALLTGTSVALGPGLSVAATHDLGMLASGNPPLARVGGGQLAMIGLTASALQVIELGEDTAPTGRTLQIVSAADGAGSPTSLTVDDGLVVAWQSGATGDCKLAKIGPDLLIAAGPVSVGLASCNDPHVAWLAADQRILVVADDQSAGGIAAAVFDPALTRVVAPAAIAASAHWARIAADGDSAWVAFAINPSPQAVGYVRIDATATVVQTGIGVGVLDETLGHFHQIDRVGETTVILWTDTINGRTFSTERLCR